jgi:hypothetical protein
MTIDDLVRMNGPTQVMQIMGGTVPFADIRDTNFFLRERQDFIAFTFFRQNVEGLSVGNFGIVNYKTAKGVGLQGTRSEIIAAYGKPTVETTPWEGGGICSIQVLRPGTARNIWKF